MFTSMKRVGLLVLAAAGIVGGVTQPAPAQLRVIPSAQQANPINPYFRVAPGLTQQQYLQNIQATSAAYAALPPWMFGYNPYPQTIVQPYAPTPLYGVGNNPYPQIAPTLPAIPAVNPYAPSMPSPYPYDPGSGWNPYWPYLDIWGGYLRGTADVMRASGQVLVDREQARLLREQANQAKIETERKRFDHEMYVKANTPSFTEEQAKIARLYLKRIQNNSSPPEILSGKSLNVMLDDLRKYAGRKATLEAIPVSGEILAHLNVATGNGNLGLLRNEGRFTWPACLGDLVDALQKKDLEVQAQALLQQAVNGDVDANLLKDLRAGLERIRTDLIKKVNDIPTIQYLEAKRFLNDFDDARLALEKGDAKAYVNFQKFVRGGKTVQEVADYLLTQGLRLAAAVQGDEGAYQAFHSGLAAYSIALNAQFAAAKE